MICTIFSKLTLHPTFLICSEMAVRADGDGGNALRIPLSPVSGKLPPRVLGEVVFRDRLVVSRASPRRNSDERRVGVH